MNDYEREHFVAKIDADLADLVPRFLMNRKNDVATIRGAIDSRDFDSIQRIGHIIKGVSGSYGFEWLGKYGMQIELGAQIKDVATIENSTDLLADYIKRVQIVYV